MTRQETFDKVVKHLRKQGCKAAVPSEGFSPRCLYRGPNGTKCAAGCLIPDDKYDPEFEGVSLISFEPDYDYNPKHPHDRLTVLFHDLGHDGTLVSCLQTIHDFREVEEWEGKFQEAAVKFNLKYSPPRKTLWQWIKGWW